MREIISVHQFVCDTCRVGVTVSNEEIAEDNLPRGWYSLSSVGNNTLHLCSAQCVAQHLDPDQPHLVASS